MKPKRTITILILFTAVLFLPKFALAANSSIFTISAWVKPDTTVASTTIASKAEEFRLATDASGQPVCQIKATSWQNAATSSSAISLGTWAYVSCTYDKTNLKIYIDGTQTDSDSLTATADDTANALEIGKDSSSDAAYDEFNGIIDDVKFYNYARTQKQIIEDMNAGHPAVGTPIGSTILDLSFDEGYGTTAYDASPQSNNGTLTPGTGGTNTTVGAMWDSAGKFGGAMEFDGTDDYVEVGDDASLDSKRTIAFWFKLTGGYSSGDGNEDFIVHRTEAGDSEGVEIYMDSTTGKLRVTNDPGAGSQTNVYSDTATWNDEWYHTTITADDTNINIYINGVFENSGSFTAAFTDAANSLYFGVNRDTTINWLNGLIDEVKIYPFALTEDEIRTEYNRGAGLVMGSLSTASDGSTPSNAASRLFCIPGDTSTCDPPVGWWKMDEKDGDFAYDMSGNNNIGRMHGPALSFDGGDYVDTGDPAGGELDFGTGNFSLECWFKTSMTDYGRLLSKKEADEGYRFHFNSGGTAIEGQIEDNSTNTENFSSTGITVNDDNWHHTVLSVTGGGGRIYVYIDGVDRTSGTPDTSGLGSIDTAEKFVLGATSSFHSTKYTGQIDEVRIYDDALTAAEVLQHYNGEYIDEDNLVGYWDFSENTGQYAYDQSVNTNTGTLGADADAGSDDPTWVDYAPAWTNGKIGSGLEFDGSDDYVDCGDITDLQFERTDTFTFSVWAKSSYSGFQRFFHKAQGDSPYTGYWFGQYSDNKPYLELYDAEGDKIGKKSGTTVNDDVWHYITASYDGSSTEGGIKLYIDGIEETTTALNSGTFNSSIQYSESARIGADAASIYFTGSIDDVRIYDYARTPAQIAWEYNRGEPIAHWRFDECSGTVAHDESGNGNDGTITIGGTGTQTAVGTCDTSGTAWYNGVSGKRNYSLNFDGTDDYVVVSDDDLFTFGDGSDDKPFSVSAWVNMDDATNFQIINKGIYNTDAEWSFYVSSPNDYLSFWLADESVASCNLGREYQTALSGNQGDWIHVTATYDGTGYNGGTYGIDLYLNGKVVDDSNIGNNPASYVAMENLTHDVWIGRYNTNYVDGQIDDVKVFNYALTGEQVKMEYVGGAVNFR